LETALLFFKYAMIAASTVTNAPSPGIARPMPSAAFPPKNLISFNPRRQNPHGKFRSREFEQKHAKNAKG
jgi:hypothetical protein